MILHSDTVLLPSGEVVPAEITIAGGTIQAVQPQQDPSSGAEPCAGLLAPGFVDTHVHGGGGGDFATTDPQHAVRAQEFHRAHGTTTLLASLVTDEIDTLLAQIAALRELCADGRIAGIHLEGPFLSAARCGAHPPALLRDPDPATVGRLIAAGGDDLAMITLAPERPGGLAAIAQCRAAGVTVAIGHTSADADVTRQAVRAGARVATHLFNAMDPIHHRRPGPVPVLLADPRVGVEVIADGTHLAAEVLALTINAAGPQRVLLVTDAMVAAGLPDGRYRLGRLEVAVDEQVARLVGPDGRAGSIAGSTLTMAAAVEYVVSTVGVPVATAAMMATSTPARQHRLAAGALLGGRRADLVLLDDRGRLRRVMSAGRWLEPNTTLTP